MLFCCLWRNVETSCHKHFAVLSRHQQTPPLAIVKCHNLRDRAWSDGVVLTRPVAALTALIEAKLLAQNRDFCLPHLHSTPSLGGGSRRNIDVPFGMEKLEWCVYPVVKKMFIRFYRMYERDTHTDIQTDRRTPHDDIGRACIASRGSKRWIGTCMRSME